MSSMVRNITAQSHMADSSDRSSCALSRLPQRNVRFEGRRYGIRNKCSSLPQPLQTDLDSGITRNGLWIHAAASEIDAPPPPPNSRTSPYLAPSPVDLAFPDFDIDSTPRATRSRSFGVDTSSDSDSSPCSWRAGDDRDDQDACSFVSRASSCCCDDRAVITETLNNAEKSISQPTTGVQKLSLAESSVSLDSNHAQRAIRGHPPRRDSLPRKDSLIDSRAVPSCLSDIKTKLTVRSVGISTLPISVSKYSAPPSSSLQHTIPTPPPSAPLSQTSFTFDRPSPNPTRPSSGSRFEAAKPDANDSAMSSCSLPTSSSEIPLPTPTYTPITTPTDDVFPPPNEKSYFDFDSSDEENEFSSAFQASMSSVKGLFAKRSRGSSVSTMVFGQRPGRQSTECSGRESVTELFEEDDFAADKLAAGGARRRSEDPKRSKGSWSRLAYFGKGQGGRRRPLVDFEFNEK